MDKYCLTLDLKNDPDLIKQYIDHHQNIWPEIRQSITTAGITSMEIYHVQTRLFMIMNVNKEFSFEQKTKADLLNPKVQEWETLMDTYQQRLPFTLSDDKWVLMDKIFEL